MIYTGEYTQEISFPIGGIGTGSFGLAGNGAFVDWEIFNHPDKGRLLPFTHIAVKAVGEAGTVVRVLQGDLLKDLTGPYDKAIYRGFGYGPDTGTMCGLPHFRHCSFDGQFPIARLTFTDPDFPATVVLTVCNPFIPLDSANSSLPVGMFHLSFENTTEKDVTFTAVFSLSNPFARSMNTAADGRLTLSSGLDTDDVHYGDMSVMTDCPCREVQTYWYRGDMQDHVDVFVRELRECDRLPDRIYQGEHTGDRPDVGSLAAHRVAAAGQTATMRFVLSWHVPNNHNYWCGQQRPSWKNYYATQFSSSVESGAYALTHFDSLYQRTVAFKEALFGSSLDATVIEAVSATLSVLKSPTVLRLEDGSFYGWEGVHQQAGSCEGTCQHVWNYAYALCFLFPDLERSIRDNEFRYCLYDHGGTTFRLSLPLGSPKMDNYRPCVDGHMGAIIKTYREWKLSGDDDWLRQVFPTVKKMMAFTWSEDNVDGWDRDRDGALEGRQHNTLDRELFGPSSWMQGFYMAALQAARKMALYVGDEELAAEYQTIFDKAFTFTSDRLFNGEYFMQDIDLSDRSFCEKYGCPQYWYEEKKEIKYQIANGCAIDQVLAQWHANLCGLGRLYDEQQLHTALANVFKYNFKSMREVFNTWRVFALNDEQGAVICTFPHGAPAIPLPYHAEVMTGFEYALAGLLISEGFEQEGLAVVRAIRHRYDGKKRNPWNEIECGSNYARAMAAFALLPIYSGFTFDLPAKRIGFNPIHKEDFSCLFSVGTGWGTLRWSEQAVSVTLQEGYLELQAFTTPVKAKSLTADGKVIAFIHDGDTLRFPLTRIEHSFVISR